MNKFKLIGYPFAGALLASINILVLALFVFGFDMSEWAEWEGRIVGIVGTVLAVAAAGVGFSRARKIEID